MATCYAWKKPYPEALITWIYPQESRQKRNCRHLLLKYFFRMFPCTQLQTKQRLATHAPLENYLTLGFGHIYTGSVSGRNTKNTTMSLILPTCNSYDTISVTILSLEIAGQVLSTLVFWQEYVYLSFVSDVLSGSSDQMTAAKFNASSM